MRLFALPDGLVNRFDRAQWMTPPFDLAWFTSSPFAMLSWSSVPLPEDTDPFGVDPESVSEVP